MSNWLRQLFRERIITPWFASVSKTPPANMTIATLERRPFKDLTRDELLIVYRALDRHYLMVSKSSYEQRVCMRLLTAVRVRLDER